MILVVGGTGTLGSVVVRELRERGHAVRVLSRDRSRAPAGVDVVVGDLRDPKAVVDAVTGCDVVISAAHGFTLGKTTAIDRDANCRLFSAATAACVGRIVMLSVYGAAADHPMALHRAKFAAEQALRTGKTPFVIVRPTAFLETWVGVIGGNVKTRGEALVLGPGRNPINFVSVRDVAHVVVAAACGDTAAGSTIEVCGPENIDFVTFANRLIAASGSPGRVKHVPLGALRVMSLVAKPFSRGFAERAQAAVVMNTIDMAATASACAPTNLVDVLNG